MNENKIIEMYNSGISSVKIAKIFNTNHVRIGNILKKNNIKIKTNKDYRNYTLNNKYFESIDSHEKAAILGFIFADGYNNQKAGRVRICIHKKDIDYLEKINREIQPDKTNAIKFTYSVGFRNKYKNDNKNIAYTVIYCKKISDDLAKIGCLQKKSLILELPNIKDEFFSSFLMGYFDGDGSIYFGQRPERKKREYRFDICCSHIFADQLIKKLESLIDIKLSSIRVGNITHVYSSNIQKIEKLLDWMYSKTNIYLNRKRIIYDEMKDYVKKFN